MGVGGDFSLLITINGINGSFLEMPGDESVAGGQSKLQVAAWFSLGEFWHCYQNKFLHYVLERKYFKRFSASAKNFLLKLSCA